MDPFTALPNILQAHTRFTNAKCRQIDLSRISEDLRCCQLQAFADILATNETFSAPMEETYKLLGMEPSSVTSLEDYLKEYYGSILKKLKEVGASSRQTDFYV